MGGFKQKGFMQNADACTQSTFQFDPPGIVADAKCAGSTGPFNGNFLSCGAARRSIFKQIFDCRIHSWSAIVVSHPELHESNSNGAPAVECCQPCLMIG